MRRCCCLRALIILWLLSMQAYSHNSPLQNFIFLQSTNNAEFFQNVPLLEPVNNPGVMTPVIANTNHKHTFKIVSRPGSPATRITLFFDDHVRLVTSEKGISVGVDRLKDNQYQINIELPASKRQRERYFSLVGTGHLNAEKIKVNDRSYQSKVHLCNSKKGAGSIKNTESDWEHIINYRGDVESNLYSEQMAWLQQPAPSEIVAMVVLRRGHTPGAGTSESNASQTAANQEETPPQVSGAMQATSQPPHSGGAGGSHNRDRRVEAEIIVPEGGVITGEMLIEIGLGLLSHPCLGRCSCCGGPLVHTVVVNPSEPEPGDE